MRILRRIAATLVMLLSVVGIACCIAVVVGTWIFRQYASEKVPVTSERLEVGLERASSATQHVRTALERASAAVEAVNKESADLDKGDERSRRGKSALVRMLIQKEVGPNVDDLGGRLATLADAAVAAAAVMQSFQELPPGQAGKLDPAKLQRLADQAAQVSTGLRRLESVVGDTDKEVDAREIAAATSQVQLLLQNGQDVVDDWQSKLDTAREDVPRIEAKILGWLTPGAVAMTLVCIWLVLSQVSLFAHARKWFARP